MDLEKLQVIKNSGLRQKGELESLLGVSRMSLYKYYNGKAKPREDISARITKLEVLVQRLTNTGYLPFTVDTDEEHRKLLVSKIKSIMYS